MHIADYFAIPGDGYQVGGGSPHTQYENYDGLSLKRAADLWRLQQLDVGYLNLLLNVTANVKRALEFEFDISKRLHYAYTHLVCRSAKSGKCSTYIAGVKLGQCWQEMICRSIRSKPHRF